MDERLYIPIHTDMNWEGAILKHKAYNWIYSINTQKRRSNNNNNNKYLYSGFL